MTISESTTIEQLAALVCQALQDSGVEAFLSGGAVVSIYTQNKYESFDLDFVSFGDRKKIRRVMEGLGFGQDKSRLFRHPKTVYLVEFPGNAVQIGDEPVQDLAERKVGNHTLKLLTPTDCVKDRLASFIHWNDLQALEQAVLVATAQPCKMQAIEDFCRREGKVSAFEVFLARLKS